MAFNINDYIAYQQKTMPVFLLLDVSSSMYGSKIDKLNEAVKTMLETFNRPDFEADVRVTIITFGAEVKPLIMPCSAKDALNQWQPMVASGMTPLGVALRMAKEMIEDRELVPSNSYIPLVVLVSDGVPTDDWQTPLKNFISSGRSHKCDRMAMAIGNEVNMTVLEKFIEGSSQDKIFEAKDAEDIGKFFKYVTMSVTTVSKQNTNKQKEKNINKNNVQETTAQETIAQENIVQEKKIIEQKKNKVRALFDDDDD